MNRWTRVAAAVALAPLPVVAFAAASPAATSPILLLGFEDSLASGVFSNSGWSNVEATVVTANGGSVSSVGSPSGTGLRLPRFDGSSDGPRAVIQVRDLVGRDRLSPGDQSFGFGADFSLDATSSDAGSDDNGDNLIQRGLHRDDAQYKLQIDKDRPSCAVKGDHDYGIVFGDTLDTGRWYRAKCEVTGSSLTVSWAQVGADGGIGQWRSESVRVAVGDVSFDNSVPMSIGGKMSGVDTVVHNGSDQFNGSVDNATFWKISDDSAAKLDAKVAKKK